MRMPHACHLYVAAGAIVVVACGVLAEHMTVADIGGPPNVGGWPGNLAREYVAEQRSRRRCSRRDCDGGVLVGDAREILAAAIRERRMDLTGPITDVDKNGEVTFPCPECETFAEARTSRAFVNGGNLRRAAQRLLDTLDGRCPWNPDAPAQPSECPVCSGRGETGPEWAAPAGAVIRIVIRPGVQVVGADGQPREAAIGEHVRGSCAACNGTGHNLRGTLPPLPEETMLALRPRMRGESIHDLARSVGELLVPALRGLTDDLARYTDDVRDLMRVDPRVEQALRGGQRIRGARFDTVFVDDDAFGREE
jgi:hypothetical protein